MPPTVLPPPIPISEPIFSRIALSISGGGFRAAAYGLGTLNTLYLLGVLDNVHMLSTISGGTFTGAYYALRRKEGATFEQIYEEFYRFLDADSLLPDATTRWQNTIGKKHSNYKIIRAFADIYHEQLFGKNTFDVFWQADKPDIDPFRLQTIIFGATELYSGLAFRFQYSTLPEAQFVTEGGVLREWFFIGNGNVHIPHARARELRLADIVASSSCFPVGFEALNLPADFPTDNPVPMPFLSGNNATVGIDSLAIIDGGVYDNQGIEGLLLANRRNKTFLQSKQAEAIPTEKKGPMQPSTLFLVADVASADMGIYPADTTPPARTGRSLTQWLKKGRTLVWVAALVVLIGILLTVTLRVGGFLGGFLIGIALIVGLAAWGVGHVWNMLMSRLKGDIPALFPLVLPPFMHLTIKQLWYLLDVRLKTAKALLLSVFLRRVRSLNYGLLYNDDDTDVNDNAPTPDVIASIIGGVLRDVDKPKYRSDLILLMPIIKEAGSMDTTLWWLAEKNKMNAVIASAEITLPWRIKRLIASKEKVANDAGKVFALLPEDAEVFRRATLIFEAFRLANDKNQPVTYYPAFRLKPTMKSLISNSLITPAQLIEAAKE
ncbi:MAG: patatin-like phospholipase family protein [Rudanella sp.]|nr:patatin-like phospholipase family protein [Rudanella sp.]